jgi:hypothetical protein
MNRTLVGVPAAGGESERPAGAGTPPASEVFFVGVPVVSLVPRSTTGYKLASLRDEESCRRCRHEPGERGASGTHSWTTLWTTHWLTMGLGGRIPPLLGCAQGNVPTRRSLLRPRQIPSPPRTSRLPKSSHPRSSGFSSALAATVRRLGLHPLPGILPSCRHQHGLGIYLPM